MSAGGEQTRGGRVLGGRYRLIGRIGSGGTGTLWQAHDELVDRDVAVKQPRLPGDPEDEQYRRAAHRLYREARAAARVDHPSAVSIHDVVLDEDGLPWIVMELVRGESLHEVLRRGPVDPVEAARIGLAVLGALRAAHAVGIVHRDVKPANVLLGPNGRVVLTDFGIAHVQGEESLTVGRGAGPAADLWSLGALLYTAVEGASPVPRTAVESTPAVAVTADPPEPRQAGPLGPLIAGLLAKDPEQRPGAEKAAAVLEAVTEGRPVPRAEAQGTAEQRESAEDKGTLRLEPIPQPDTAGASDAPGEPAAAGGPRPSKRALPVRPVPLAAVAVLLVGGTWFGTSYVTGSGRGTGVSEGAATLTEAPARATPDAAAWTAHREADMDAVLYLPERYRRIYWTEEAGSARLSVYEDGADDTVAVRLAEWRKAPAAPMTEAKKTMKGMEGHQRTAGRYTATTFHGDQAALSDVTYDPDGRASRVLQLVVRTADDRMYRLQVQMPQGTPDEKQGTAVFEGARDRLRIGVGRTTAPGPPPTP